jgi:hypothetical protein
MGECDLAPVEHQRQLAEILYLPPSGRLLEFLAFRKVKRADRRAENSKRGHERESAGTAPVRGRTTAVAMAIAEEVCGPAPHAPVWVSRLDRQRSLLALLLGAVAVLRRGNAL